MSADSSSPGRSFRRGCPPAVPELTFDIRATILGSPTLAFEHAEHGQLVRRQGIPLNRLEVRRLGKQSVRVKASAGYGIALSSSHGPKLAQFGPSHHRNACCPPPVPAIASTGESRPSKEKRQRMDAEATAPKVVKVSSGRLRDG